MTAVVTYVDQTRAESACEWIRSTCRIPCDVQYSELAAGWTVRVMEEMPLESMRAFKSADMLAPRS